MIKILLLIAILVAGYLSCIRHPELKCRIHLYSNRQLYLRVIEYGLYSFLLSVIFLTIFVWNFKGGALVLPYLKCLSSGNCISVCASTTSLFVDMRSDLCTDPVIAKLIFDSITLAILTVTMLFIAYLIKYVLKLILFFKYKSYKAWFDDNYTIDSNITANKQQNIIGKIWDYLSKVGKLPDALAVYDSLSNTPLYQVLYGSTIYKYLYMIIDVKEGLRYYGKVIYAGEINEIGGIGHSVSVKLVSAKVIDNKFTIKTKTELYKGSIIFLKVDSITSVIAVNIKNPEKVEAASKI